MPNVPPPHIIAVVMREVEEVLQRHRIEGKVKWKLNAWNQYVVAALIPAEETVMSKSVTSEQTPGVVVPKRKD